MITNNTSNSNVIIPTVDPGVTATDIYQLGLINGNISIQESVGGTDQGDIYSFTINEAGEFSFNLEGLTANANLGLFDAQEQPIEISQLTGTSSESITANLAQGDYFIVVGSADGGATNYNLNISNGSGAGTPGFPDNDDTPINGGAETIIPTVDPGYSPTDAYQLGLIEGNISIQQAVGGTDDGDAYSFSIDQTGEYSFSLEGLSADADLYLFDANGEVVELSETEGIVETESFSATINAGSYFLGVSSWDGVETNYTLNISDGSVSDIPPDNGSIIEQDDPGNTFDTAADFGTFTNSGNNIFMFADAVSGADEADFFKFTVTESQQFSAAIENLTADADLVLYDNSGEVVELSATDGIVDTESFSTTIDAGSYFLGVHSWDGVETNYTLNIESSMGATSPSLFSSEADGSLNFADHDSALV